MVTPAQPNRRFLAPGDKLGKHVVIRQIAKGGMAELYLTRAVGLEGFETLACVKRMLPQDIEDPALVQLFLNEARLAATLSHPNIAQIYDIGQDRGAYFFSMEYVHGEDLGRLVATGRENGVPISLDCALTLAVGLCAGLHHAHDKAGPDGKPLGVVHRDVAPSNVLVSYDGAVKLVDFGIAHTGSEGAPASSSAIEGKVSYMSPEQCRGRGAIDRRSDVFSIGTILYELTTGQLPFIDDTEYGVLHKIVNQDAEAPSRLVPGYPPALEAIVMRALARDPDRRYATALELQLQLEDFAHGNRLRVSPLVLARLMSTLFPARLEEWDHARAQGAFFVEQHVVRTLIESGKTADNAPRYTDPPAPSAPGEPARRPSAPQVAPAEGAQLGPRPRMSPVQLLQQTAAMVPPHASATPPRALAAQPLASPAPTRSTPQPLTAQPHVSAALMPAACAAQPLASAAPMRPTPLPHAGATSPPDAFAAQPLAGAAPTRTTPHALAAQANVVAALPHGVDVHLRASAFPTRTTPHSVAAQANAGDAQASASGAPTRPTPHPLAAQPGAAPHEVPASYVVPTVAAHPRPTPHAVTAQPRATPQHIAAQLLPAGPHASSLAAMPPENAATLASATSARPLPGLPPIAASTPTSASGRAMLRQALVPNMPGAVPIMRAPLPAPPVPSGGTLVSSATQAGPALPLVPPLQPIARTPRRTDHLPPFSAESLADSSPALHAPAPAPGDHPAPADVGRGRAARRAAAGRSPSRRPSDAPAARTSLDESGDSDFGRNAHRTVADLTERVRAAAPRSTLVTRAVKPARSPVIPLALMGAIGAAVGVWIALRTGRPEAAPDGLAPSEAVAPQAITSPTTPASPPAATAPAPPPTPSRKTAAPEPPTTARTTDAPPPPTPSRTTTAPVPRAAAATPPEALPRAGERGADTAELPPATAVAPAPSAATRKKSARPVGQERPKAAKPSRVRGETRRPARIPKAEPKEQPWNNDSPFLPEPTPKR